MKQENKKIKIEVAESIQEDIDKGIARIPSEVMKSLNFVSGDLIEVKAKKSVVLKVMRGQSNDLGKKIIRLDGTTRSNIGTSIGDEVEVSLANVSEAKTITLSPMQEVRFSDNPTEYFHNRLLDTPLTLNQKIVIDVFGTKLSYVISKILPKVRTKKSS